MAESKLHWGILSTANIGRAAVIPAIQNSTNGEVVAVASRDKQAGEEFAARLGIPVSYGSYEALLDDPQIEAVYIPLPNSMHCEWTIKAARAGKHVLCEKPLALDAGQCMEMDAAAKESGVLLMEAFMYRFHPRTEAVIAMVRTGTLGNLRMIQSSFTFKVTRPDNIRLRADMGGGSLMDVGSYCVNISRTLASMEPEKVQAVAIWTSSGVDGQMIGSMVFPDGLMAQFDSGLTMTRRESYTAAGTDGFIYAPAAFLPGKGETMLHEIRDRQEILHKFNGCDEYQLMVEHFSECVLEGKPLRYSVNEATANMRVIDALINSARSGGIWKTIQPV